MYIVSRPFRFCSFCSRLLAIAVVARVCHLFFPRGRFFFPLAIIPGMYRRSTYQVFFSLHLCGFSMLYYDPTPPSPLPPMFAFVHVPFLFRCVFCGFVFVTTLICTGKCMCYLCTYVTPAARIVRGHPGSSRQAFGGGATSPGPPRAAEEAMAELEGQQQVLFGW